MSDVPKNKMKRGDTIHNPENWQVSTTDILEEAEKVQKSILKNA